MSELITTADVQYDTTHLSNVIDYRVKNVENGGLRSREGRHMHRPVAIKEKGDGTGTWW